jgi:hypothetical protein
MNTNTNESTQHQHQHKHQQRRESKLLSSRSLSGSTSSSRSLNSVTCTGRSDRSLTHLGDSGLISLLLLDEEEELTYSDDEFDAEVNSNCRSNSKSNGGRRQSSYYEKNQNHVLDTIMSTGSNMNDNRNDGDNHNVNINSTPIKRIQTNNNERLNGTPKLSQDEF